ncbi:MAG: hypothetical protein HY328_08655 [Chloroflexi bacterium]|nr:hypothetical protein [Chloroflexota bacterium]
MTGRYSWTHIFKGFSHSVRDDENGQSLVIFSLFLTILIGMLAIVLDLGYGTVMQRQMQLAADAAALAGAADLATAPIESIAIQRMQDVLTANNADAQLSTFTVIDGSTTDVWARLSVPTFFSGLFGLDEIQVEAHASAAAGQIVESGNLMPFVVQEGEWVLGQPVVLWEDQNGPGNFGWVRWTGQQPNTPTLEASIDDPSRSDTVSIGDLISGHSGVSFKPVQSNLNAWIGETVTVILYDPDEVQDNGSNLTYTVRGFAYFVLTGTYSHGSNSEIYGTFVSYVPLGGVINPGVTTGAQGVGLLQ